MPQDGTPTERRRPAKSATAEKYTRVSTHESFELAEIAMQLHDAFSYVSNHNYGRRGNAKIYRCVEHQLCGKYLRIRKYACEETQQVKYDLEHRGKHSVDASTRKRTGIHPAFRVEVDTAVMAGGTPTKVVLELRRKYKHQPQLLCNVPTEVQVKNRKAHLTRAREKRAQMNFEYRSVDPSSP